MSQLTDIFCTVKAANYIIRDPIKQHELYLFTLFNRGSPFTITYLHQNVDDVIRRVMLTNELHFEFCIFTAS